MTALWWAANVAMLVAAIPLVMEAGRIVRSLSVVHGAAVDIRDAASAIARDLPPAVDAVEEAAMVSLDVAARLAG